MLKKYEIDLKRYIAVTLQVFSRSGRCKRAKRVYLFKLWEVQCSKLCLIIIRIAKDLIFHNEGRRVQEKTRLFEIYLVYKNKFHDSIASSKMLMWFPMK